MHFVPINYADPGFNPAFTADFQLLIILNQNTFSYAVRHFATQKLVCISTGNQLNELFDLQSHSGTFASSYQKVVIAVETNSFCLIPNAIFTPENLLNFAAFLVLKEADLILTDQLENGENTVIFTFPEELIRKTEAQFPSAAIVFAAKSWIKTVFQLPVSQQKLYLYLAENQLQVLFPDQKNIRFYNQFVCSTLDELVYYTALVADQLRLKPAETTLVISGRVAAAGEQMLRLQQFFKEVALFALPDNQQDSSLPQHQIVDFLGLS